MVLLVVVHKFCWIHSYLLAAKCQQVSAVTVCAVCGELQHPSLLVLTHLLASHAMMTCHLALLASAHSGCATPENYSNLPCLPLKCLCFSHVLLGRGVKRAAPSPTEVQQQPGGRPPVLTGGGIPPDGLMRGVSAPINMPPLPNPNASIQVCLAMS